MSRPDPITFPGLGHRGRLGNSLFQIASTVGIASARGRKPLFPIEWAYRPYFNCPDSWFGVIQPRSTPADVFATHIDRRARAYLQDVNLWSDVQEEIWGAFQPSDAALAVVLDEWTAGFSHLTLPVASVHVRRGDYVTNSPTTCSALPPEWYLRAVDTLNPGSTVVFSDDIEWCREQFGDRFDHYYHGIPRTEENKPEYHTEPVLDWVDVFLQSECDLHVISNSTYSWWGAWLSRNPHPVFPGRWYGSDLSYIDWRLMIPSGWVEVPVEE